MLASIHPLGERGRTTRWSITAAAYLLGSVVGGALLGGVLGALGSPLGHVLPAGSGRWAAVVVVACAVAIALDAGIAGLRVPTIRRQVDEDWLHRYRGWVYGLGFGFQLGAGLLTIVTSASVYLAFTLALVSGSIERGLLVGLTFGAVRGAAILTVAGVRDAESLRRVHRRLQLGAPRARRLAVAGQGLVLVTAVASRVVG